MYAFLRAPQSPADFSGMAPVWRKIDACVQETWRSKNKKIRREHNFVLLFTKQRLKNSQPEGSRGPFGDFCPLSPALECFWCPLHRGYGAARVHVELWGIMGWWMGEGHATGHGCVLLQSGTLPGAVGKECFRLLYDNSCGVQWASAHTSCLPTEARSELPANSAFLRNVENVTILQSGSSHQIIILLTPWTQRLTELFLIFIKEMKSRTQLLEVRGTAKITTNTWDALENATGTLAITSHQGSPGLALLEGEVVKWTSLPTGGWV